MSLLNFSYSSEWVVLSYHDLNLHFSMTNDEHFFICLLAIPLFSFVKCLVKSSPHFLIGKLTELYEFFIYYCYDSFVRFWEHFLPIHGSFIHFHNSGFWTIIFHFEEIYHFLKNGCCFLWFKNLYLLPGQEANFLFSSRDFIVLTFNFKSIMYLKLIFVYSVICVSRLIPPPHHIDVWLFPALLITKTILPHWIALMPLLLIFLIFVAACLVARYIVSF